MEATPHGRVACGGAVPHTTRLSTSMTAPGHPGDGTPVGQLEEASSVAGGVEGPELCVEASVD